MIIKNMSDLERLNTNKIYKYTSDFGDGILTYQEFEAGKAWFSCHNFLKDGYLANELHGYAFSWVFNSNSDFEDGVWVLTVKTKCIEL